MTTYRRTSTPTASLQTYEFPFYNEALEFSRKHNAHRPIRTLENNKLTWRVVVPSAAIKVKPLYQKLPSWTKPVEYSIAERLFDEPGRTFYPPTHQQERQPKHPDAHMGYWY